MSVRHSATSVLRRVVIVAVAAYGLVAFGALLAWTIVGDGRWTLPLNATTFWWSLPAIPLFVIALLLRSWGTAVPLAVPAVLFVWAYGGLFVGSPPDVETDLRVASYNTFIQAPDISHVVDLVQDEEPDILLVQEVQPRRADQLRSQLGDVFPHMAFEERQAGRIGGVGVLSRYPIIEERRLEPVGGARPTTVAVVDVDGQPVQIVPVHLTSPCLLCGDSVLGRQAFEASQRRREMATIIDALDPQMPVILGGDLNSTRRSDPYRLLAEAGFRDPQIEAGSGPGFTWPDGSGPFFRIDWILVRGATPTGSWVDPPRASDHRPVIVDLALDTVGTGGDGQGP